MSIRLFIAALVMLASTSVRALRESLPGEWLIYDDNEGELGDYEPFDDD